ncbi:LytS/YhcK type 5TM receptor domain-containing protein [Shewanella sp. 10N.286.48.A6]|uniref:LytS/YhcK type 5TM receptor domain-containing protein n=1 Tax=Shewanella sp. 10N.286.48.A6 TaxID=1880833 RepID=UPI000CBE46C3|nr:LytS/YhcK type 5TM receptor domain-containing protein [Shewanella sp. 10N.286.48.A6]PMH99998.1 ECF transporter S component [Shewanella sp. 10N.286.48.A6]
MYTEQLMMLIAVFERAALMLMLLFLLTRTRSFQKIITKPNRKPIEMAMMSLLFTLFAVMSTYTGIEVDGSLVNVRIIAVLSGGILFGPWVGIPAGIISGLHRYLIDLDGATSTACLISSIFAGFLASWIHVGVDKKHYTWYGILAGVICEVLTMVLIVVFSDDYEQAMVIVRHIGLPMILGTVSIGLIIKLVQDIDDEKDWIAAQQAKLALDIANKTLPYFRQNDRQSLIAVCQIIRLDTQADVVAITDTTSVLAYVGIGQENYLEPHNKINEMTEQAVATGKQIISNNLDAHDFHSLLIIPLMENNVVTGTLKIFYREPYQIKSSLREMAVGLSQLISTQMEVSRIEQLKTMASKAEFSALQSKINPHFLFNALNAISTLIRIRPQQARELIAKLADFLRFNLDHTDELIDIQEELQQVRDYAAIEQARFGPKLTVSFDIDDVQTCVPSLLIQPLVENAILHGIQPASYPGEVLITVKKQQDDRVKITIRDTGVGIDPALIDKLHQGTIDSTSIGLMNVHQRLKLLYGAGLEITALTKGTEMSFFIH